MSARQSPVERDARRYAVIHLRVDRDDRTRSALQVLNSSAESLASNAAQAVLNGNIPAARRWARAYQLVDESRERLLARRRRDYDAELAQKAAEHGIKAGDVMRVTRNGISARLPIGTMCTIETVAGDILYTTIDGERLIVWAADVERVKPEPPAEPDPFQVGEDVLTPSRGAGVVEHVDVVSGVTVRVADGETWRYEPDQLARYTPAGVGDRLIVRGIGAQATVLDVQDDGYSVRYDDAPENVLRCLFGDVVQVLTRAVAA